MLTYRVAPHESFYEIGQKGLNPAGAYTEVQALNPVKDPHRLPVGRDLRIPQRLLRTTPISATVESFRGLVNIEAAGVRTAAAVGRSLDEGAVIETGENAFVRLALPDGSHIALPSNSRIRLDRLRQVVLTGAVDRAIGLQKGRAESIVTPMKDRGSRYVVSTPVAMTSVRGTDFRVAYDPDDGRGSAGVIKGVVAASNARSVALINAGQGVTATAAGISKPEALLPAPSLLHPNAPQTEATLQFTLQPIAGAKAYRMKLAMDGGLTAPLREELFPAAAIDTAPLPDGAYFAQFTAIAADGLEGEPAVYPFVRIRNSLTVGAVDQEPAKPGRRTVFHWTSDGPLPGLFHFVLSRQGDAGPPLIDKDGLTEPQFTAVDLAPGDYRWRVTATRVLEGRRVEVWSDPQPLQVAK